MSVRRAALINMTFSLGSSAMNIALVPLFLSVYGLRVYGALSLLTAVSQYFSILDLGLSSALVRHRVRVRSHGDPTYFYYRRLMVKYFLLVGLVVVGTAAVTALTWGTHLHLDGIPRLWLAVLGAGALTLLSLIGTFYNSALVAEIRFTYLNSFNLARNIGPQVASVLAYSKSNDLAVSLTAGALCSLVLLVVHVARLHKQELVISQVSSIPERREFFQFLKESLGFSAQTFFSVIMIPLLQTVVGVKFGSEANGLVEVARRLLFAFRRLIEAAFVPLFARANQLIELRDTQRLKRLAIESSLLSAILSIVYFVSLRVSTPWILSVWLGNAATAVRPITAVFLIWVTFTMPHIAVYQLLSTFHKGRVINTLAGAVSSGAVLFALLPVVHTVVQTLVVYASGTFLGAAITLLYSAMYFSALRDDGGIKGT